MDATFGQVQTTPLQWAVWKRQLDIVRLLLNRGASQDHITTRGWNTTFFCWPRLQPRERPELDLLYVLAADSYQYLDVADTEGLTVLHRVSAFGLTEEVTALMNLGGDPEVVALPLRWNAIHHAVFYGNYPVFKTLLPYYTNLLTMTDLRGWTLLHIAASAGHDQIVRHLLRLGSDPNARSKPFMSHMPESLFGRACTPQEVAAAQIPERERQYLDALRDFNLLPGHVEDSELEEEDDDAEFWEAFESLV